MLVEEMDDVETQPKKCGCRFLEAGILEDILHQLPLYPVEENLRHRPSQALKAPRTATTDHGEPASQRSPGKSKGQRAAKNASKLLLETPRRRRPHRRLISGKGRRRHDVEGVGHPCRRVRSGQMDADASSRLH
jgi:hypothetical protein